MGTLVMGNPHNGRSADGFLENYNYHDWTKYMVRKPEDKPTGPHFAAVLFDTRTEYTPAYDSNDRASTHNAPEIHYFAFPEKATLEAWLLRAEKAGKKFFFFEVKRLGDVSLKVNVSTDL